VRQFLKTDARRAANFDRAALHQHAILSYERHDVSYGAERDKIEFSFQIKLRQRPRLQQRMAKLEYDPNAAEIMKW